MDSYAAIVIPRIGGMPVLSALLLVAIGRALKVRGRVHRAGAQSPRYHLSHAILRISAVWTASSKARQHKEMESAQQNPADAGFCCAENGLVIV